MDHLEPSFIVAKDFLSETTAHGILSEVFSLSQDIGLLCRVLVSLPIERGITHSSSTDTVRSRADVVVATAFFGRTTGCCKLSMRATKISFPIE